MTFNTLIPKTLLARIVLITLIVTIGSQLLAGYLWTSQLRTQQESGLQASADNLARSIALTISYIYKLPSGYRSMALDQLKNMGGSQFFISLNSRKIQMQPVKTTNNKELVYQTFSHVLEDTLGRHLPFETHFVERQNIRLFDKHIRLQDLPHSPVHHILTQKSLNPPILVTQVQFDTNEWLYLATLLPSPYSNPEPPTLPQERVWSITIASVILALVIFLLVYWQTRPLKSLAHAVQSININNEILSLPKPDVQEVKEITDAFHSMQVRIHKYLKERSQLFSSISHDIRTPITRLRLRAELLDNETLKEKFNNDLQELDMLAKEALQCIKDEAIYENQEAIDINLLLEALLDPYFTKGVAQLYGQATQAFWGKPLAIKRCFGNLIDNATKYGGQVTVTIKETQHQLDVYIDDNGPGLPESLLEKVFEFNFRASEKQAGYGIGLSLALQITQGHGGGITLSNRLDGGLRAHVILPRSSSQEFVPCS